MGDRLHHAPAIVVDAVDTTGAGDIFRAAFIYALLQRRRAARDSAPPGGVSGARPQRSSCTREGAMTSWRRATLDEIQQMLRRGL